MSTASTHEHDVIPFATDGSTFPFVLEPINQIVGIGNLSKQHFEGYIIMFRVDPNWNADNGSANILRATQISPTMVKVECIVQDYTLAKRPGGLVEAEKDNNHNNVQTALITRKARYRRLVTANGGKDIMDVFYIEFPHPVSAKLTNVQPSSIEEKSFGELTAYHDYAEDACEGVYGEQYNFYAYWKIARSDVEPKTIEDDRDDVVISDAMKAWRVFGNTGED